MKSCQKCLQLLPIDDFGKRSDSDKPQSYCLACRNVISREFRAKQSMDGQRKYCKECKKWKMKFRFQPKSDGRLNTYCKICMFNLIKAGKIRQSMLWGGGKICIDCRTVKSLDLFPNGRGYGNKQAYCIDCIKLRSQKTYIEEKEIYHERTRRWRAENPEANKSISRLSQYKRRATITANNDNTVTDDFLIAVYTTEICVWCHQYTEKKERTLEHIIPLSRGGYHSIFNIEMACRSCNSSKTNKTLQEWADFKKLKGDSIKGDSINADRV